MSHLGEITTDELIPLFLALHKKIKFFTKDFFSNKPNPQFPTDFVTFTVDIVNGKLYFLSSFY